MERPLSLPLENPLVSGEPAYINALIHLSVRKKISFAFWKLPHTSTLFFTADFSGSKTKIKPSLEDKQGFIFSPFNQSAEQESYFIQADLLINLTEKKYQYSPTEENRSEDFLKEVLHLNEQNIYPTLSLLLPPTTNPDIGLELFQQNVLRAIQAIESTELKKVVLARARQHTLPENFNFAQAFTDLCQDENAFVSLVSIPGEGIWMGGSPELLVSVDKNSIFKTVALAGTQILKEDEGTSKAVWTQKEIEEQALVSRYIINCFKTIRLREYEEDGPHTVMAGNLMHLKTSFSVNMNEVNFPNLGSIMLELLHPTSAVCGMPKDKALEFIDNHEKLDRKFYSGFLGPVNLSNETHVFVNIRCAEFRRNCAYTYSGAGITQESNPEKEFTETELKMKIMEKIVNSHH